MNDKNEFILNFHGEEDQILVDLTRETALTQLHPRMMSGWYQGNLLNFLIQITNSKSILEIGTYSGYSSICMARAIKNTGGKLITFEINDEIEWLPKKYFKLAGLEDVIDLIIGDALEHIASLQNNFDFIFIDGDKRKYIEYYEAVFPKLKTGGLILIDNILWDDKIFKPIASNDYMTQGIAKFNSYIKADNKVEKIILPLRDGLMLLRKK